MVIFYLQEQRDREKGPPHPGPLPPRRAEREKSGAPEPRPGSQQDREKGPPHPGPLPPRRAEREKNRSCPRGRVLRSPEKLQATQMEKNRGRCPRRRVLWLVVRFVCSSGGRSRCPCGRLFRGFG